MTSNMKSVPPDVKILLINKVQTDNGWFEVDEDGAWNSLTGSSR